MSAALCQKEIITIIIATKEITIITKIEITTMKTEIIIANSFCEKTCNYGSYDKIAWKGRSKAPPFFDRKDNMIRGYPSQP